MPDEIDSAAPVIALRPAPNANDEDKPGSGFDLNAVQKQIAPDLVGALSRRAKLGIVLLAFLITSVAIGLSCVRILQTGDNLSLNSADQQNIAAIVGHPGTDASLQATLTAHVTDEVIGLKAVTNHQSFSLLAIALAVGFLTIGFALFILGTDGAFRLEAADKGDKRLAAYGTAPGLLCFLLAAVLVVVVVTHSETIEVSAFNAPIQNASTGSHISTVKAAGFPFDATTMTHTKPIFIPIEDDTPPHNSHTETHTIRP